MAHSHSPDEDAKKNQISARAGIAGVAIALAVLATVARGVIVGAEFDGLSLLQGIALLGRAVFQDYVFVLAIAAVALAFSALMRGPRGRRRVVLGFGIFCALVLFWHLANILVVHMLGEPLSLSWLLYSDLLNSTYAFEAVLHFVDPARVALAAGALVTFLVLAHLFARVVDRWLLNMRSLIPGAAVLVFVGIGLLQPGIATQVDSAKFANPVLAFGASLFHDSRVEAGHTVAAGKPPSVSRPPIGTVAGEIEPQAPARKIRNVVLFVMESTAAKYVDGFGGTLGLTPNLARHAESGISFHNIYAHAPASNYSLVSLMAGIVPELSRYSMTYSYPELVLETMPAVLRDSGYRTGFFSSSDNRFQDTAGFASRSGFETVRDHWNWDCDRGVFAFKEGADEFLDTASDLCTIPPVLDWIEEGGDTPFFATIWTGMSHYPYYPGETPQDYDEDANKNRYLNALRVGDEAFADLMQGLEGKGLLDETLVVAVGDHGEAFGEHGNYVHARALYQENIHVPLVFINAGLFSGANSDVIGGLSDVAPTVLSLLDIPIPASWQGLSLFGTKRPDGVLFFTPWNGFQIGFRHGTEKFIYNANSGETWLFDLASDPTEQDNLMDAQPARAEEARKQLTQWIDLQNTWTDSLVAGTFVRPRSDAAPSSSEELVVYATGTRYLSAPRGEVRIDGVPVGSFDVSLAPDNADAPASDYEIDSVLTAFQIPYDPQPCAKKLEVLFLNDEWAGENQSGDTDLYVQSVEINGRRYWPYEFHLETDRAGGQSRFYYRLWRSGGFSVDLDLSGDCLTEFTSISAEAQN